MISSQLSVILCFNYDQVLLLSVEFNYDDMHLNLNAFCMVRLHCSSSQDTSY